MPRDKNTVTVRPYDTMPRTHADFGDGSSHSPFQLTRQTLEAIEEWRRPLDLELMSLPKAQHAAFIAKCRIEAVRRWPWWFPGCHAKIVD